MYWPISTTRSPVSTGSRVTLGTHPQVSERHTGVDLHVAGEAERDLGNHVADDLVGPSTDRGGGRIEELGRPPPGPRLRRLPRDRRGPSEVHRHAGRVLHQPGHGEL